MQLQLKKLRQEQLEFPQYLNSLGIKKMNSVLKIVNEFKQTMFDYYLFCQDEFKSRTINALKLYLDQLNTSFSLKQISKRQHTEASNALKTYFQYLTLQGIISEEWLQYLGSTNEKSKRQTRGLGPKKKEKKVFYLNGRRKKDYVQNPIFRNYIEQLKQRNASCIEEHYSCIAYFLRFLKNLGISELESLPYENIKKYEQHLELRFQLKEIKKTTAYGKLLKLKSFVKYLYSTKVVRYKYDIPHKFKGNKINRDNEFVTNEDRLTLIETMIQKGRRHMERDLAITLIFVDIGCRPIEVCNIRIKDVNITESSLTLYCRKSGQRTLKIDKFVMNQIAKYLEYRNNLPAATDHLFLLETGEPMNTKAVGGLINGYNKDAFGEARFSAKSLRHTFITNALNDRNDIRQVAQSAGHKHLVSTLHYFYRSIELMLENTLPHNPVEGIDEIQ